MIYDRRSLFKKAAPQHNRMMSVFGESTTSIEERAGDDPGLLFRAWHPASIAFDEDENGEVDTWYRKFTMSSRGMCAKFDGMQHATVHDEVKKTLEKSPDTKWEMYHIVMPARDYEYQTRKPAGNLPWASIYIDCKNNHVIREKPARYSIYYTSRWQMVPGLPDGFSPAAMTALGLNRRMQQMYLAILESAEKQADPPLLARPGALIDGEINLMSGHATYVDEEYDERQFGKPVEAIDIAGNMNTALETVRDARLTMAECWYINKLQMPSRAKTAYETEQLVQEYIRANLPIVEPLEYEVNSRMLDKAVEIGMVAGAFGPAEFLLEIMPEGLEGSDIHYAFENPLRDAIKTKKTTDYRQMLEMVAAGMQLDPDAKAEVNIPAALADAVGTLGQNHWVYNDEEKQAKLQAMQQEMQVMQAMQMAQQGGEAMKSLGDGAASMGLTASDAEELVAA